MLPLLKTKHVNIRNVLSIKSQITIPQPQRPLSSQQKNSYYEILGVSQKASQKEIKNSYFKLCGLYHPDKAGSGDLQRFQEITKAYEVLGNYQLRKRYDRGYAIVSYQLNPEAYEDDDKEVHHIKYDKPPPKDRNKIIHKLDEAVKQSQTEAFERKMENERTMKREKENSQARPDDTMLGLVGTSLVLCAFVWIVSAFDKNRAVREKGERKS